MLPVITVVHVQRPAVGGDVVDDGEGEGDNGGSDVEEGVPGPGESPPSAPLGAGIAPTVQLEY